MTAEEWRNRIVAVCRAAYAGDPDPIHIVCEQIAAMEANQVPVHDPVRVPETPLFPEQEEHGEDHQTSEV